MSLTLSVTTILFEALVFCDRSFMEVRTRRERSEFDMTEKDSKSCSARKSVAVIDG